MRTNDLPVPMPVEAPPHNLEAEQCVLGALLRDINHTLCRQALDDLSKEMFYSRSHGILFSLLKNMVENKQTVDLVTITDLLENNGDLDAVGGFVYVAQLIKNLPSIANTLAYTQIVIKTFTNRMIMSVVSEANDQAHRNVSPTEVLSNLESNLKNMVSHDTGKQMSHISDVGEKWLDKLDARIQSGGGICGLATGIDELDRRLAGFDDESLIVLAGRPSMGKTLLAQTICVNVGVNQNLPTMFFSMEMSDTSLYERFISNLSGVSANSLRTADLSDADWGNIGVAAGSLQQCKIFMDSDAKLAVGQIRARVRRHVSKYGKQALIVIDYLGLMKTPKADRHDLAIGEITSSLKNLVKEVKTPILLLAQANRDLDKAKRPTMSNLKDSSSIEADADVILFVHRDEVINPDSELKGITEIIIAKDRHNDGNGTVYLEKRAGGFVAMDGEAAAQAFHNQEVKNRPQKKARGYAKKDEKIC